MIAPKQAAPLGHWFRMPLRRIASRLTVTLVLLILMAGVIWLHPAFLFGREVSEGSAVENLPVHADDYLAEGDTPGCSSVYFPHEVLDRFLDWTQLAVKRPSASTRLQLALTRVETLRRDEANVREICRAVALISVQDHSAKRLSYSVIYTFNAGAVDAKFSSIDLSAR
jgi:hypothetical protein